MAVTGGPPLATVKSISKPVGVDRPPVIVAAPGGGGVATVKLRVTGVDAK